MPKRFDDWEIIKDLSEGGPAWTPLAKKMGGEEDSAPSVLKRFKRKTDSN
jgi:hypothetical protein